MDYTADMLGAIQFGLSHMGSKTAEKPQLYSDFAHRDTRRHKTDNMTAQQIIGYIYDKL